MNCVDCSASNIKSANFCRECGHPMPGTKESSSKSSGSSVFGSFIKGLGYLFAALILMAILSEC